MSNNFQSETVVRRHSNDNIGGYVNSDLRQYMIKVYNYMGAGLAITGVVSFLVSQSMEMMYLLFTTPLRWVVLFAPLVMVFLISARTHTMKTSTAQFMFWTFSALMGLSISSIFLVYTGLSIARMFFITASVFGVMSLYGYTTRKDLTSIGSFLFMGLIGVIIASVINLFFLNDKTQLIISVLCVIIFTGLTAYDTQNIKNNFLALQDSGVNTTNMAINGALSLYLDFINLFLNLLRLFGERR